MDIVLLWIVLLIVVLWLVFRIRHKAFPRWWITRRHTWWSHILCFLHIHVSGHRDAGCLHNVTVCHHCGEDVAFVLTERK